LAFGDSAFSQCVSLTSICIPSSVKSISKECFVDCTALSAIAFEADSQVSIFESEAFYGCSSLESICLPSSVTSVAYSCFGDCFKLVNLTFAPGGGLSRLERSVFAPRGPCS
jgi:hypothetical protein